MYININYAQAKRLLSLINEYMDLTKDGVGDVIDLNSVTIQLEDIIEKTEHEG